MTRLSHTDDDDSASRLEDNLAGAGKGFINAIRQGGDCLQFDLYCLSR
jgi:hypothetical protein